MTVPPQARAVSPAPSFYTLLLPAVLWGEGEVITPPYGDGETVCSLRGPVAMPQDLARAGPAPSGEVC